jgi:hypothetical protein
VRPPELLRLLEELFREKAALRDRHIGAARAVGQYDFNNAYQYVIAREDQHLAWIGDAIREMGGTVNDSPAPPDLAAAKTLDLQRSLMSDDARGLDDFVTRWRERAAPVNNARQKLMIDLIFGEMLEQARVFHQAGAGRLDLLGRRTGGERTEGRVLPTRWVE